jgi:hypothetical protein
MQDIQLCLWKIQKKIIDFPSKPTAFLYLDTVTCLVNPRAINKIYRANNKIYLLKYFKIYCIVGPMIVVNDQNV